MYHFKRLSHIVKKGMRESLSVNKNNMLRLSHICVFLEQYAKVLNYMKLLQERLSHIFTF